MKQIDYYVNCFDRYLNVIVFKEFAEKAEQVMEEAYIKWHNDAEDSIGFCCEEYILISLEENGIAYREIKSGQ